VQAMAKSLHLVHSSVLLALQGEKHNSVQRACRFLSPSYNTPKTCRFKYDTEFTLLTHITSEHIMKLGKGCVLYILAVYLQEQVAR
jgi:hypothetical protein